MRRPQSILSEIVIPLNIFLGLVVKEIVKEYVFVMLMPSHSHGVTFGHILLIQVGLLSVTS